MSPKQIYTNADNAAELLKQGKTGDALKILEAIKAAAIREEAKKWLF